MSYTHVLLVLCSFWISVCVAIDKITSTQSLKNSDSIVSSNGDYKLGFFTPVDTTNRYIGIWYNKVSKDPFFWVANRNNPLNDTSGILTVSTDGNLVILNGRKEIHWSSNISITGTSNTSQISAQLLDTGNLVLVQHDSKNTSSSSNGTTLWQSFDHPTDCLLPNAKITFDKSNMKSSLPSWKSPSDPSIGRFSLGTDSLIHSQAVVYEGNKRYWRSGPWNGNIFLGLQYSDEATNYANTFVRPNPATQTVDLDYTGATTLSYSHYALSYDGTLSEKYWDSTKGEWAFVWEATATVCDFYSHCGSFGICNAVNNPVCKCLKGYIPKNVKEWNSGNWSNGCVRSKALQCGIQGSKEDGFLMLKTVKVPDLAEWSVGLNQVDCRSQCLKNCSCVAYAYDAGAGCMYWSKNLIDFQKLSSSGVDLYLRLPASLLATKNKKTVAIIVGVIVGTGTLAALAYFIWRWLCRSKGKSTNLLETMYTLGSQIPFEELPLFDLKKLIAATNDFHLSNKLGEGGFGPVFKGKLEDGQEIAVKRLSAASGQGVDEFMNEVVVISKLQHRNLVKLLGCCVEKCEKMLVYEYMPNKSLDFMLFDSDKNSLLNWEKRFSIIEGISRGLVYLHRDSRLRIIHRDLKASNILLDEDLNPKISDFGMARIFNTKQDQDSTRRVVGTYGYMSPEYAMGGHFSEKSDVYSFGVLLLEIVTGRKNSSFWLDEQSLTLLGYMWKLWTEEDVGSIIDPVISDPSNRPEVIRCIHVGLLCVQEFADDRPSTSTVLSMIVNDIAHLPIPKQSGFTRRLVKSDNSESSSVGGGLLTSSTGNYNSITHLSGR